MMYLLDTHILLWWLTDNAMLNNEVRSKIADPEQTIFISAASIWEISIKSSLGKITLPKGPLDEMVLNNGFEPLLINLDHADMAGSLASHHSDPFDRMLVAQAKIEKLTLISHDRIFKLYGVKLLLC